MLSRLEQRATQVYVVVVERQHQEVSGRGQKNNILPCSIMFHQCMRYMKKNKTRPVRASKYLYSSTAFRVIVTLPESTPAPQLLSHPHTSFPPIAAKSARHGISQHHLEHIEIRWSVKYLPPFSLKKKKRKKKERARCKNTHINHNYTYPSHFSADNPLPSHLLPEDISTPWETREKDSRVNSIDWCNSNIWPCGT